MTPEGWKSLPIHELAVKVTVGIASAATHAYRDRGVPLLRNQNIKEGFIDDSDILYIDRSYERYHREKRLQSGDIITVRTGYPGLSAVVPEKYNGAQCFTSLITRPKKEVVSSEYLCLFINSPIGKRKFAIAEAGGAQKNVNAGTLKTILVHVPPLSEQLWIVSVCSQWDRAIDLTEKLLTEKQQLRSGLMQQLLTGKQRMTGFTKPWQTIRLGEAFRNRVESKRTDLPLLSIAADRGVIPRKEIERKDSSSEDKSKYLRICPGDIGYNTMRMWQGVSGLSSLDGIVSPAYTIVTPKKGIDGEFMALFFKSLPIVHLFYRFSQGLVSDTWNLKFRHFAEIKVLVPEEAEQKAIATVFRSVNREIELLQAKTDALREQKKGLMQQLLTGKKRIPVGVTGR